MIILGISGSLRRFSHNSQLLRAAAEIVQPTGIDFKTADLSEIPLYNSDLEENGDPDAVARLRAQTEEADALLFASPEYNYSMSGVLKNAIDWLSRPAFRSALTGRPCGIVSASLAPTGGVRAQMHLRVVLAATLSPVFPSPDFMIPAAHEAFDENGILQNERSKARLRRYMQSFVEWASLTASIGRDDDG